MESSRSHNLIHRTSLAEILGLEQRDSDCVILIPEYFPFIIMLCSLRFAHVYLHPPHLPSNDHEQTQHYICRYKTPHTRWSSHTYPRTRLISRFGCGCGRICLGPTPAPNGLNIPQTFHLRNRTPLLRLRGARKRSLV